MRILANIFLWITCFFLFVGFFFKFKFWPGGSIAIIFGTLTSILGILFYLIARYQDRESVQITTYYVYFFFFIMAFGAHFFVGNPSVDLLSASVFFEKENSKINSQLNSQLQKKVKAVELSFTSSQKEFYKKSTKVCRIIDEFKDVMIDYSGGVDELGIPYGLDNQDVAAHYIIWEANNAEELKQKIQELKNLGISILGKDSNNYISENLNREPLSGRHNILTTWNDRMFYYMPLGAVLANLELLKTRVLQNQITVLNLSK